MNETSTAFPAAPLNPPDYVFTGDGEVEHLTVFRLGADPISIGSTHPLFDEIRDGVKDKRLSIEDIMSMVDMSAAASQHFDRISDRVTVSSGQVFFDGDAVHSLLAEHIVRCLDAKLEDWRPLVKFMEKLALNPSEHSREQLYGWLSKRAFTITADGDFIAYKGVRADDTEGFVSINHGPAIVNGVAVNGAVPNPPRRDRRAGALERRLQPGRRLRLRPSRRQLRVRAQFAAGGLLKVKVNPRDVVSVPTECDWQKMRVCRYEVLEQIDAPETKPIAYEYDEDFDDFDYCDGCDELIDECMCAEAEASAPHDASRPAPSSPPPPAPSSPPSGGLVGKTVKALDSLLGKNKRS